MRFQSLGVDLVIFFCWISLSGALAQSALPQRRVISVQDSISTVEIGDGLPGVGFDGPPVLFSPDRKRFLVVLHHGDIRSNTNDYSLVMFDSASALLQPKGAILVRVKTSANAPGISNVRWLGDNRTVVFLKQDEARSNVFSIDSGTRVVRQITHEPTDVGGFETSSNMATLILEEVPPTQRVSYRGTGRSMLIAGQSPSDMLSGTLSSSGLPDLLILNHGVARHIHLPANTYVLPHQQAIFLSPDGNYAILRSFISETALPPEWKDYREKYLGWVNVPIFIFVDIRNGKARFLLDAPAGAFQGQQPIVWSSDSKHVLVNSYLPLDGSSGADRIKREDEPAEVQIDLETAHVHELTHGPCEVVFWDSNVSIVTLRTETSDLFRGIKCDAGEPVSFQETGNDWSRLDQRILTSEGDRSSFDVKIDQDMNTPPRLFAVQRPSGAKTLLLDPNPQFHDLNFARVHEVHFKATDGTPYAAGVYLPPDYVRGRRYPLVIQTHGWDPKRFALDGESTAGYAAQELAGAGIVVVQLPLTPFADDSTPKEGPVSTAQIQGIVQTLDQEGLIDRNRIALQGWSRTCVWVRYALAFSRLPIAAALIVDGYDPAYLWYMLYANNGDITTDNIYGGPPEGPTFQSWVKNVPEFNLDRVHTPALQFMFGDSLLEMWELQAGLKLMHKPVESVWMPDSYHWPLRPSERVTVQQGAVDWFRFWLQGYEDPKRTKREQYTRWERLCDQQRASDPKRPAFCISSRH